MTNLTIPIRLDRDSEPNETLHVTASGLPVRVYSINGSDEYPIHGAIYIKGIWMLRKWRDGGKNSEYGSHAFDLRDRPKAKRGWWVVVFERPDGAVLSRCAETGTRIDDIDTPPGYEKFGIVYVQEGDGLDTPADPPLVVDWSRLPKWAKWAAADEDGLVWGYSAKPEEVEHFWHVMGAAYQSVEIRSPLYRLAHGVDWRATLIQRPEGV